MKKALSALFFFAISYSYGQNVTTADTIIAKKGFKLANKKVVAISNDTAIASNDSTKLITEYAAKTFAKRYAGSSSYTPSLQQVTLIDSITTKSIWIKNGNYPNGGLKIGKQVGDTTQPNIILQNTLSNGDDNAYLMFGRAGYTKQFVFQDLSQTDLFYLNNFANEHSFVVPSISSHLQDIGLFADIANNKSYLQLSGYDYLGKIKSDSISVSDKDYFLPNQSGTLALRSDVAAVSDALESYVPYTGAMFDVDLDDNNLSAKGVSIMGTGGNGHIHLKHQSSDASSVGSSTTLFANSSGYLKWKNDGNYYSTLKMEQTADRVYTFQNKSYTLADSTTVADSVVALRNDLVTKASTQTITGVKTINPSVSGANATMLNLNGTATATAHDQILYGLKASTVFDKGVGTYRTNERAFQFDNGNTQFIYTNRNGLNNYSSTATDTGSLFLNRTTASGLMNILFSYSGATYAGIRANYTSGEFRMGGFNSGGYYATIYANNAELARFTGTTVGIGVTAPTATLHLKAGTATASSAPLKFNSGTNLTTVENGAIEYDGTSYYASAGGTRQNIFKGRVGSYSGTGTATTSFTVTFGGTQPNTTYQVLVTPTNALTASVLYVTSKTTTTFTVTFLSGLTGTVEFDWALIQQ